MFLFNYIHFSRIYSIIQLLTECHRNKQQRAKFFEEFCSISFTSATCNFSFVNLQRFQTPIQKFDFCSFKFEFETKPANFQNRSCLVGIRNLCNLSKAEKCQFFQSVRQTGINLHSQRPPSLENVLQDIPGWGRGERGRGALRHSA